MKKWTFFYKFDKNRNIAKSSNHNFFNDDEDKAGEKLNELLSRKEKLIEMISVTDEAIEEYYFKRRESKIHYIESNNKAYLYDKKEYFSTSHSYILSVQFNKILTAEEIEKIKTLLWVKIIRIFWYDTCIEFFSNNKKELIDALNELVNNEIISVRAMIQSGIDYANNRFILTIESIDVDVHNRTVLDNSQQELIFLASFSKEYLRENKEEREILKNMYFKYAKSDSNVEIVSSPESLNTTYLFQKMNDGFIDDIKLLDWLINIEILSIEDTDSFTPTNVQINIPVLEEWIWDTLSKICVLETKAIRDNPYFLWTLSYGRNRSMFNGQHWTSVWLLSMYGKLDTNNPVLPNPDAYIYNIVSEDPFGEIESILQEAEENGCKIINISLGVPGYMRDNDNFSTIARKIDMLLANRDLLVILSWGNIQPSKTNHLRISDENANINIPKDSISSIVVGAKNDSSIMELYSRKNNINPEFMIWSTPGYMYRLKDKKKPDFIDFGENIVFDGAKWWKWYWTSYAAPLIANKAAKLLNIYPSISTNTIKALFTNYSSLDDIRASWYSHKNIYERHVWRWGIRIEELLSDDNYNTINIVIEDYISSNQRKEYFVNLPNISTKNNLFLEIKRSISYNPPIDENYHLKYSKFCVSSSLWSSFYEQKRIELIGIDPIDKSVGIEAFRAWKHEKIDDIYTRPINWVNYFGNNNFWTSNSYRKNNLNYDLYKELQDWFSIIIEGHSRLGFSHDQKFSFVMTIDISQLTNRQAFIDEFFTINQDLLIHWENIPAINQNIDEKNMVFNELITEVSVEVEGF